jgi:hypothetical protein
MRKLIAQLLTSKKALATLVAAIVWLGGRFGLDVDPETLLPLVAAIATYVLAQGIADAGKEAKKIEKGDDVS